MVPKESITQTGDEEGWDGIKVRCLLDGWLVEVEVEF